jgi:ribosomal protein S18 acetylase RimI-like enzyme
MPGGFARLRAIAGSDAEARIVQAIYDAAPEYSRIVGNDPGRPGAAAETFAMLPEGCNRDAKNMFLIETAARAVGFVDVIRGFPDDAAAYVGLFVIAEMQQRQGIGRAAYEALERRLHAWRDIHRVRLSVVATNEPALRFWRAMGFAATGERQAYACGPVNSESLFFEKILNPDPAAAFGDN